MGNLLQSRKHAQRFQAAQLSHSCCTRPGPATHGCLRQRGLPKQSPGLASSSCLHGIRTSRPGNRGGSEKPVLLLVGLPFIGPLVLVLFALWVLIFLLALQRVLILGPRVRSLDMSQSKPTCKRLGTASSAESSPDREIGSEKQCAAHHSNRSPHPGSPHTGSGKLALSRVHPQRKSSRQVAKNLALGRGQLDKLSA